MATWLRRSGDYSDEDVVATLRVHVAVDDEERPTTAADEDEHLFEAAVARRDRLEARVRDGVAEHLGPEFDVRIGIARTGSIELVATILLVGSLAASYNSVREGLMSIRQDWKWFTARLLAPLVGAPVAVDAYYRLGPAAGLLPVADVGAVGPVASARLTTNRQQIPIPGKLVATAYGLLFVVLLGWLTVPLLIVAGVL